MCEGPPKSKSFSATRLILGGVVMPDSISGLFGALESDMRWSKLFLVPEGQTRRTLIYDKRQSAGKHVLKRWSSKVVHTQKLLCVGLGWLAHVKAHWLACAWTDLADGGVGMCRKVAIGNLRWRPRLSFPQGPDMGRTHNSRVNVTTSESSASVLEIEDKVYRGAQVFTIYRQIEVRIVVCYLRKNINRTDTAHYSHFKETVISVSSLQFYISQLLPQK